MRLIGPPVQLRLDRRQRVHFCSTIKQDAASVAAHVGDHQTFSRRRPAARQASVLPHTRPACPQLANRSNQAQCQATETEQLTSSPVALQRSSKRSSSPASRWSSPR